MNGTGNMEDISAKSVPQYEVVSARGNVSSIRFNTAAEAVDYATQCWPDQEQDPDRTGKGWDIQISGVDHLTDD